MLYDFYFGNDAADYKEAHTTTIGSWPFYTWKPWKMYGFAGNDLDNIIEGNDFANELYGYDGDDVMYGGAGNDILTGGTGKDTFVFNAIGEGIDIIKDFQWTEGDKIAISKSGFGATSLSQFSYNSFTGALFFNQLGAIGATYFATVENKPVGFDVTLDIVLV